MYSNYGTSSLYGTSAARSAAKLAGAGIWTIIAFILAIVGGILVYFLFLSKKNEGKFKGFWGWTYDFLLFKKLFAENLLKVLYLIGAIFITLASFGLIAVNFLVFLLTLVVGNIVLRIVYEFLLIKLLICRNTTEINAKLSKEDK